MNMWLELIQPRLSRTSDTRSNFRLPEMTRAAKLINFCTASRFLTAPLPYTDRQYLTCEKTRAVTMVIRALEGR